MGNYKIIWRVKARRQYIHHLSYAYQEFGTKAFYKWVNSVQDMEDCLEDHPRAYMKVPELSDMFREYRGHIVMKNFKIIYSVDDQRKQVRIVAIWDMRMEPKKLLKLI